MKVVHVINNRFASVSVHPRGGEEIGAIWPGLDLRCAPITDAQARLLMNAILVKVKWWKGWIIDDQRDIA